MAEIKVRMLPDWVVETHRARAESSSRSLEEEIRCLLTNAALESQRQFAETVDTFRKRMEERYGTLPDSTAGIVEDRERQG